MKLCHVCKGYVSQKLYHPFETEFRRSYSPSVTVRAYSNVIVSTANTIY